MWPNPQFPGDLVAFTEEIPNGKFLFFFLQWYSNCTVSEYLGFDEGYI